MGRKELLWECRVCLCRDSAGRAECRMEQEGQGNSSEPTRFGVSLGACVPRLQVTRARLGHRVCPSSLPGAGDSGDIPAQPCSRWWPVLGAL